MFFLLSLVSYGRNQRQQIEHQVQQLNLLFLVFGNKLTESRKGALLISCWITLQASSQSQTRYKNQWETEYKKWYVFSSINCLRQSWSMVRLFISILYLGTPPMVNSLIKPWQWWKEYNLWRIIFNSIILYTTIVYSLRQCSGIYFQFQR